MSDFGTCPAYGTQCEYVAKAEAQADAVTQAAADERAKILAWLRGEAQALIDQSDLNESYCLAMLGAATDIEAGEHLK